MASILLAPLRLLALIIGSIAFYMEYAADWIVGASSGTEYVRKGSCRRCGSCCRQIVLEMPVWIARRKKLVKLATLWHRAALGFKLISAQYRQLSYSCPRFIDGGKCGKSRCRFHLLRPRLCRFYPKASLFGKPSLFPSCGFYFARRDGGEDVLQDRSPTITFSKVLEKKQSS